LDADVTHGELVFKVVDDSAGTEAIIALASNEVSFAGDPAVATIAYTALKAAIDAASPAAGHDKLSVSYVNNAGTAGSITNDGSGIGDITADVFGTPAATVDPLTILFDDTNDVVTISGLDVDVTHSELVFKVVDDSAGAQATTEATIVLALNQVAIAGDVATIAYTDLKAAIESASNTAGHDELSVSYLNNAGSIANDGLGIGDITADVFII
jgi:hypothetical protein